MRIKLSTEEDPDFLRLYDLFRKLMNYCIAKSIPEEQAEEIVNEAFTRLLSRWDAQKSKSPRDNKLWLYKTVTYIIKENQRESDDLLEIGDLDTIGTDDTIGNRVEELHYAELTSEIERRLGRLYGSTFHERYVNGLSNAEVAEKLGITEVTVRTRVSRLRRKLIAIINDLRNEGQFID